MSNQALGERDLWLAGASALVAAVALTLALGAGHPGEDVSTTPTVASLKQASGEVKVRLAFTLGWRGANRGVEVHDGDALFVPPGAEATLAFIDGTELALDERSLVVIERPRAGVRSVTLRQGSVSGRVGSEGLTLQTTAGEARLEALSEARVELTGQQLEVSVKKGTARVQGGTGAEKTIASGQRVAAARAGTTDLAPFPVTLLLPEAQARFPFRGDPAPVTLTWSGELPEGTRVQVARDRLYAFVDQEVPARGGSLTLKEPSKGVTWWRLVDAEGRPVSEARRFTCTEDVAPVAMYPRSGEVLLAPPGTAVAFAWAPLPGISRYRLEISPSQGFEPVTVSEVASGATARLSLSLNEAMWFWRVRVDDESGLGAPSEPMRFRVIHKGIPEAPELLNPEIEVTP
ncbi:MAG: FecR domain-containing protein [Archangium sp.]|nr:FecR domain-containing protein [Archangium sp.]